jgi:hypothetical protein
MEHPLEVSRVGERVISDTRRDIAKDAILEEDSFFCQQGKNGSHLPLPVPPPRRRPSFTEAPGDGDFPGFEGSVKLEMIIGCVFRIPRGSCRLARKKFQDLSFPDRIDSATVAAFQSLVGRAQGSLVVGTAKIRSDFFRTRVHTMRAPS